MASRSEQGETRRQDRIAEEERRSAQPQRDGSYSRADAISQLSPSDSLRGLDGRLRLTPLQRRVIDGMRQRDGAIRPTEWRSFQAMVRTNGPGLSKAVNILTDKGLVGWVPGWRGQWAQLTDDGLRG